MAETGLDLAPYRGVFGLPPPSYTNHEMIANSMPVLEIFPGEPQFSLGLSLFRINLSDGWKNYSQILNLHGFSLGSTGGVNSSRKSIKLAFIADNFPTDTFANEYTETFLQKFTDVASGGLSQMIQMSGAKNFSGALKNYGTAFEDASTALGEGAIGSAARTGGELFKKAGAGIQNFRDAMKASPDTFKQFIGGSTGLIDKMLSGHRIDFPQIWSNSSYSPSYSVTVRLYNPDPGNKNSTLRYIAGPLCAILCLAVPRSDNGASYRWPFYHKMRVKGLYELNPAVITNITVVKGGDQQQIAFNQNLGMVDVRIDFISLHKSMLLEEKKKANVDRPTVRGYIRELTESRKVYTRAEMNNINNTGQAGGADQQELKQPTEIESRETVKKLAAGKRIPATKYAEALTDRVSEENIVVSGVMTIQQRASGVSAQINSELTPEQQRGR